MYRTLVFKLFYYCVLPYYKIVLSLSFAAAIKDAGKTCVHAAADQQCHASLHVWATRLTQHDGHDPLAKPPWCPTKFTAIETTDIREDRAEGLELRVEGRMMQQAFAVQAAGAVAVVVTVLLMYQNFGARQLPPVSFTERLAADWDDQFAEHTSRGGNDEATEKVDRVCVDAALARAAGLTTAFDLAVVAKADASPKVAFMFLLEAGTVHEPLWRKYFSEASDQSAYSIYVHTADPEASTVAFADMAIATRFHGRPAVGVRCLAWRWWRYRNKRSVTRTILNSSSCLNLQCR